MNEINKQVELKVVHKELPQREVKHKPKEVIDFLNQLHLTEKGRLSLVVMPNFQGKAKHLFTRQVEALEKIDWCNDCFCNRFVIIITFSSNYSYLIAKAVKELNLK